MFVRKWIGKSLLLALGASAMLSASAMAEENAPEARSFERFVQELQDEALNKGIRQQIIRESMAGITHIDRVIELDRKQPEFTFTAEQYLSRIVNPDKVAKGRRLLVDNKTLLDKMQQRYGVPSQYIVALWGIETDYGRLTGGFPIISALATLSYDGRRSAYFRTEFFNALKILDEGHISASDMTGSWAGAMGQCQFMPSSFLRFAEDGDGDGKRDIWQTRADVFASASNYLAKSGWQSSQGWGRPVTLPSNFSEKLIGLEERRSIRDWTRLGVKGANGKALPGSDMEGSIIIPKPGKGQAYLVYDNFRTIMKWNKSYFFALAVGTLADKIAAR